MEDMTRTERMADDLRPREAAAEDLMVGRRIGPYQVLRRLGQGGMDVVYLAQRADEEFRKQVARKRLRPGFDSADQPTRPSDAALSREGPASPRPEGERHKLHRRLSGDLDNIVLMALRKEPRRRYASVDQLSADLRRYLEGHPVTARKATLLYRSGKFVRRNRWSVVASALSRLIELYEAWDKPEQAAEYRGLMTDTDRG